MLYSQPLHARVVRATPAGLIVALPDGRQGLVRDTNPEILAKFPRIPRYKPGDSLEIVVQPIEAVGQHSEEIWLAEAYLWNVTADGFPVGALVSGVVDGIMPYGVFVELEKDFSGLVHISHLPDWKQEAIGDVFWPGDLVKVTIDAVDRKRRRVALSMRQLEKYRWNSAGHYPETVTKSAVQGLSPSRLNNTAIQQLLSSVPKSIVVVEDEEDQRLSLANWLRNVGQRVVYVAEKAEEALAFLEAQSADLVLMDIGLPGMDGIAAARQIRFQWPELRCVLMTDWGRAERRDKELTPLRKEGVSLLIKPLLPNHLAEMLLEKPDQSLAPSSSPTRMTLEQSVFTVPKAEQSELAVMLLRAISAAQADKAVLFELDTDQAQIKVFEHKGPVSLRNTAWPELIYSPIRNVAEEQTVFTANHVQQETAGRLRYVLPLLDFGACCGVPVPAHLRKRYALFLFFSRPLAFIPNALIASAEGSAARIASWLERQQLIKQTADLQRVALLGQLSRTVIHEISGRISPLNLILRDLEEGCKRVEQCALTSPEEVIRETARTKEELQKLTQQTQSMAHTMHSFGKITRSGVEELIRLDEVAHEVVSLLSETAKENKVELILRPAPKLYFTRAMITYLQQVLVNVVQNAIQQIALTRPERGGRVEIQMLQTKHEGKNILRLYVQDDGPGIHQRLWERIFEMDYTTREDGSGLGLFIARSLIESQGGRVFIESSHTLWGTTMAVELPYRI
ncbi:MAG: response regulator [Caldilineales bacterium]